VKRNIGVTAQDATVDEVLTGRQNLVMIGRLSGLRRQEARARAGELLERFDLLDEPTTGLDPTSRVRMWNVIRGLIAEGVTLLLTTQYLDEADELADRIVVIDHGRAIADGTAAELKREIGGARLEVVLTAPHAEAERALAPLVAGAVQIGPDGRRLQAPVRASGGLATRVVRALDDAGIEVDDAEIRQPSLDDVFFALTGHPSEDGPAPTHETDNELEVTFA
jgi:ABC-2 type transport system ATP-binding protein